MDNPACCEICGDEAVKPVPATDCGHTTHLCETCKKECPGALRLCASCGFDEWYRERHEEDGAVHEEAKGKSKAKAEVTYGHREIALKMLDSAGTASGQCDGYESEVVVRSARAITHAILELAFWVRQVAEREG